MPSCSHPYAHPRRRRGAVLSSIPQGRRRITANMATTINKYIRKRYKGKFLAVKVNDFLCETCFTKEERRTFGNKNSTVYSSDEELSQSISSTSLSSALSSKKTIQTPSKSLNYSTDVSSSLLLNNTCEASSTSFLHSTPVVTAKELMMNSLHNVSSTDITSPSDNEAKYDFTSKVDKKKLNTLLDIFDLSPIKDARNTNVLQEKCQDLLKKTKRLSDSFRTSSSTSAIDTTTDSSVGYEDMHHLITGLKKLVVVSDHSERIRLLTLCPPSWSRRDISTFFSVTEWEARMAIELHESYGVLSTYENNQDRGKLTPLTIQSVLNFYEDDTISRCSSNSKDTINVKGSDGKKVSVCCRYMVMSLKEAFELFKNKYKDIDDIKIGYSKFCYLRPKWVKLSIKKNTCLCLFHENFRLVLVTLSSVIQESIKSNGLTEKIVCSRMNSSCMYGDCSSCRTKLPSTEIPKLYSGIDTEEEVTWMKWINLNGKVDIHRLSGSVNDLLIEMDHQWSKFTAHSYVTNAQFEYIRNLKESLPSDTALVHMDFSENYALEVQNEVMSKHWSTAQAALFTIQIRTTTGITNIVIVSDYLSHDTIFVSCGQRMICNHIRTFYPFVTCLIYLSDGCAAHFKNNLSMLNLIKHNEDHQYKAEWIFYSTSHGKGPVDGLGAVVKSAARRETMRADGPQKSLLTPVELYNFLKKKFYNNSTDSVITTSDITSEKIHIWYLSEADINQHFEKYLSDRFKTRPAVGPIVDSVTVRCKVTSDSVIYKDFSMLVQHDSKLSYVKSLLKMDDVNINDYIAVEYQDQWWLAMVQSLEANFKELRVTFLHPSGPRTSFKFPRRPDELNIELGNVICLLLEPPKLGTRYNYMISQSLCDEIEELFAEF